MKTFLLLVFSIATSFTAFCQKVDFITLEVSTPVNPDYAHVKVSIFSNIDSSYNVKVESISMRPKIDAATLKMEDPKPVVREIRIVKSQFQALVDAVQRIKQKDIVRGPYSPSLDGTSCSISYGMPGSSVTYHVSNPKYDTGSRGLNDYLLACELILRTAELDPQKLL